jgi:hypothetical protein
MLKDSAQIKSVAPSPKPLLEGGSYSQAHMDCKVVARTDEEEFSKAGTIHNTHQGGCLSHYSHILINSNTWCLITACAIEMKD